MVFINCDEPERLQGAGERRQHFCCAQHRPRLRQKHQLGARAPIQRAGQVQQSAGDGNDLQLASNAASAVEPKYSRGSVRKPQSWCPQIGFGLQGLSHSQTIMFPGWEQGTLPKYLENTSLRGGIMKL